MIIVVKYTVITNLTRSFAKILPYPLSLSKYIAVALLTVNLLHTNPRFTLCSVNVSNSSILLGERNRQKSNVSSSVAKHQKNGISCKCNYSIYLSKKDHITKPQIISV